MISVGNIKTLTACLWASVILFVVFSSCTDRRDTYITLEGQAQGTTFHIVYQDSLNRNFTQPIDSLFRLIDKSMSLWDSTSLINRINRNETNAVSDVHFQRVYDRSIEVSRDTEGAFDVTVGPLVRAWGFSVRKNLPLPDSAAIDSLLQFIGYQKLTWDQGHIIKSDPRIHLDFNAIAQGYTIDLISAFFTTNGIRQYLVELGGEVRAQGVNERNGPWQVGIDKPTDTLTNHRPLQTSISLHNKALATSGNYRKYIKKDDGKWSHIINPKTGYPTHDSLLSVSVLADDAMTADAYATAFLVMGLKSALEKSEARKLDIFCIYTSEDGTIQTVATPGFMKR